MKIKHLFAGLVATLSLGAATTASVLVANKNAKEIKVAEAAVSRTVYCAIDTTTLGTYTLKVNANVGDNNTWVQSTMVDLNDSTTFPGKKVFSGTFDERYGGVDAMQFQLYDGSTWKAQDQVISSWTTSDGYSGKLHIYGGAANSWQSYTQPTPVSYAVSVGGGAHQSMTVNPSNSNEYTASVTATAGQTLSFFRNDSAYAVTGEDPVNNNVTTDLKVRTGGTFTVYLKINTNQVWASGFLATEGYIYYVSSETEDTPNYIYSWGGSEQFGTWPGTAIRSVAGVEQLSGVVNFNGSAGYIYKIPVDNSDSGFKFSNNGNYQSNDKTLTLGGTYWYDSATADENATTALNLIDKIEKARNAASYIKNAKTFNYTVCGISASKSAELYNEYAGIGSATAKSYFDSSTTYTWKDATSNDADTNQKNWTFAEIIHQLGVQGGVISASGSRTLNIILNNEVAIPAIVSVIGLVTMTAVGGFFFLKKKPF